MHLSTKLYISLFRETNLDIRDLLVKSPPQPLSPDHLFGKSSFSLDPRNSFVCRYNFINIEDGRILLLHGRGIPWTQIVYRALCPDPTSFATAKD